MRVFPAPFHIVCTLLLAILSFKLKRCEGDIEWGARGVRALLKGNGKKIRALHARQN